MRVEWSGEAALALESLKVCRQAPEQALGACKRPEESGESWAGAGGAHYSNAPAPVRALFADSNCRIQAKPKVEWSARLDERGTEG